MPNVRRRGSWAGEEAWLTSDRSILPAVSYCPRSCPNVKYCFFGRCPPLPPSLGNMERGGGGVAKKKKGGTYVSVGVCWSVDRVCMHIAFQTTRLPRGSREYNYFPAPVPGAPRNVCNLLFYHRRIIVTTNTGNQRATGETCPE